MEKKLLSARDVAELINWHPVTVYKKALINVIPGRVKLGGSLRFRKSEIDKWLRGGKPRLKPSTVKR